MQKRSIANAPYCIFVEALEGLALAEVVEVAAGTELRQQATPSRRLDRRVKGGQERVLQHFQYFPLCPRPLFLVPTHKLLLVHYLGREHALSFRPLHLRHVHAPDVAAPHAPHEPDVAHAQRPVRRAGFGPIG